MSRFIDTISVRRHEALKSNVKIRVKVVQVQGCMRYYTQPGVCREHQVRSKSICCLLVSDDLIGLRLGIYQLVVAAYILNCGG